MAFQKQIMLLLGTLILALVACTAPTDIQEPKPTLPPQEDIEEPIFCTQDVQECPDGSYVGRNPDNNCEFFACPEANSDDEIFCTTDIICCDGKEMGRDPTTGCSCPEGMNKTLDACQPTNGQEAQLCDANTPCKEGFSCYAINGTASCYSDGSDICQLAGCEDTCVMLQSFPPQIVCN